MKALRARACVFRDLHPVVTLASTEAVAGAIFGGREALPGAMLRAACVGVSRPALYGCVHASSSCWSFFPPRRRALHSLVLCPHLRRCVSQKRRCAWAAKTGVAVQGWDSARCAQLSVTAVCLAPLPSPLPCASSPDPVCTRNTVQLLLQE